MSYASELSKSGVRAIKWLFVEEEEAPKPDTNGLDKVLAETADPAKPKEIVKRPWQSYVTGGVRAIKWLFVEEEEEAPKPDTNGLDKVLAETADPAKPKEVVVKRHWQSYMTGGVGVVIGLSVGYLVFNTDAQDDKGSTTSEQEKIRQVKAEVGALETVSDSRYAAIKGIVGSGKSNTERAKELTKEVGKYILLVNGDNSYGELYVNGTSCSEVISRLYPMMTPVKDQKLQEAFTSLLLHDSKICTAFSPEIPYVIFKSKK